MTSVRHRLGRLAQHLHHYREHRKNEPSETPTRHALAAMVADELAGFVDELYARGIQTPVGKFYAHHLGEYMRRYLLMHPYGTVRLHLIQAADRDPDLHDHPWDFASFILSGGYTEVAPLPGTRPGEMRLQRQHYGPGSVNLKRAADPHRIVELDGPTWTLVFTGRRIRKWGFFTPCGWVAWGVYTRGTKTDPDEYRERLQQVGASE